MVTSLPVASEKVVDAGAGAAEGGGPLGEQAPALGRQPVPAARRPRGVPVPLGADEALVLERAQQPVEIAHVRGGARERRRDLLEQLRPVGAGAVADEEEHGGL